MHKFLHCGLFSIGSLAIVAPAAAAAPSPPVLSSPDQQLSVTLKIEPDQRLSWSVQRAGRAVLLESRLGLRVQGADLATRLQFEGAAAPRRIDEHYELALGKKRRHQVLANERDYSFVNPARQRLKVTLRVSNDGVALRYTVPGTAGVLQRFESELTSFRFAPATRAWLQPMSVAKTGWNRTNPAYEEHYLMDIAVGTPSPTLAGWVFPALLRSGEDWVAISEAGMDGSWHGSRLQTASAAGEYVVAPPAAEEVFSGGHLLAQGEGDLVSPWRLMVVGTLKTVVESTLGTDLAPPAVAFDPALVLPGQAAWSWALLKDDFTVFEVQKKFIDYAAEMRWRYTLIDADWDRKIGHEGIVALVAHGASKGVGILLWYNSAGDWNDAPYTPRSALLAPAQRAQEFSRLRELGVKGVKVDFFGGDGASMLAYYLAILKDAAAAGLLVNFHGATLPRGWARTWPNLMTVEAVKGFEFTTFGQRDQDRMPAHAAMLPFARNLFDPMDYTPLVFGEIPNIIRSTRNGFELAQAVLFTSGIQHFAEIPEGMATVPAFVKAYLQAVPERWDETRFIDGVPGEFVVIARRAGDHWHVAGINARDSDLPLTLDLSFIGARPGRLIGDGSGSRELVQQPLTAGSATALTIKPRGGFVAVFAAH